jgi:hypothetical protein
MAPVLGLDELLGISKHSDYYRHAISKLSDGQRQRVLEFANELALKGAKEPLSWALSEVEENIAQRARYYALREFHLSAEDIEGSLDSSSDFCENPRAVFKEICNAIGEESARRFLSAYGKGMLSICLGIIDEGGFDNESVGWSLIEEDSDGNATGRIVSGLHEDWIDFSGQVNPGPPV